jgi:LmbE family N-acetylglucosaminyl deacetylase
MKQLTRRSWLSRSSRVAGALTTSLPLVMVSGAGNAQAAQRKLKVIVVGAHVDDPQSGCGGTIARCADRSHDVVALSLTRGDSESIAASLHMPPQELAAKRYADALRSCALLNCRLVALNYINRGIAVTMAGYKEFADVLLSQKPDIVFTHWPIDTHPDHRAASLLTYDAWLRSGKKFPLYFYEVEMGQQTQDFWPTHYVDITEVAERKKAACYANTVTVQGWWPLHEDMQRFRGDQKGCKFAEAFNHHPQSPEEPLLPEMTSGSRSVQPAL